MKKSNILLIWSLAFASLFACAPKTEPMSTYPIIPAPMTITDASGHFTINKDVQIVLVGEKDAAAKAAEPLRLMLAQAGLEIPFGEDPNAQDVIVFELNPGLDIPAEGYQLDIEKRKVHIKGTDASGLYFAVQTIRQLLPESIEGNTAVEKLYLPAGSIQDNPEYAYRGMMLDVARHFFSVEDVKRVIDLISKYKINHLHLHLSDDQGWRIEIKSWPLLTRIGSQNEVGGGQGGFYTQEQYKDIVAYAAGKFITIVPEIDMPGHTNSALNSYGILNPGITVPEKTAKPVDRGDLGITEPDDKATPYHTGIEVGFSTLDTDSPTTYQFIDDVIRELAEITPGPYIHIGGDESHVTALEDYIPFIEKAQAIVTKYGKKTMGWDEVAHAKLLPTSVAQFWAKGQNARMAIEQGSQILVSPAVRTYLDMQYDSTTQIGLHWAAYIELDDAYNWDPLAMDSLAFERKSILGVEAPLWSETVTNLEEIEFMTFPRLPAIAEIAWTPTANRSWESFSKRIAAHGKRWELMGVNYYKSPRVNWDGEAK